MNFDFISSYKRSAGSRVCAVDLLKFIAAVFVVFIHCSEALQNGLSSPFGNLLWLTTIPLFFFCSGFVASPSIDSFKRFLKKIAKNAISLLIPCLSYGVIKTFLGEFDGNFLFSLAAFVENPETNLWFLWVLFVMDFFFYLGVYAFGKVNNPLRKYLFFVIPTVLTIILVLIVLATRNGKLLSIQYIAFYFPFYCSGFLASVLVSSVRNPSSWRVSVISNFLFICCLVALVILIFAFNSIQSFPDFDPVFILIRYLGSFSACVTFFSLFGYLAKLALFKEFSFLGKFSLQIYYLHILFWKAIVQIVFSDSQFFNFVICSLLLLLIVAGLLSLMFFVPFVHLVMFGRSICPWDEKICNSIKKSFSRRRRNVNSDL